MNREEFQAKFGKPAAAPAATAPVEAKPQVGEVRNVHTKCKSCNVENETNGVCSGCGAQMSYQ